MRLLSDEALAAITIAQEAAGEEYRGQLAVAEVIRRRMKEHVQSDGTVAGTVLRSYQFSGWNSKPDFLRIRTAQLDSLDREAQQALQAWAESAESSVVPDAVFYYNPRGVIYVPDWATPDKFVKVVGSHHFYRR